MAQGSKRKCEEKGSEKANKNSTSTERKKQRLDKARNITVQLALPRPQNASSVEGMPCTIDVESFVEARAFEINAMQEAMDNAANGGTQRIWQTLPRYLRRRAASHDVRRVPARLRQKARAEMDVPAKPSAKKNPPKRGKTNTITRTEDLLKRQKDKVWLETHVWHARRMHMENIWGYRLAKTPTDKSFRPSHRASIHGCILHDASYEAIVELKGSEEAVKAILTNCADPQAVGPGAFRFTNGSRICYTHMYRPKSYPFDLLGPVEILWKTTTNNTTSNIHELSGSAKQSQARSNDVPRRAVWIRCHPLIFDALVSTIKQSVETCLTEQGFSKRVLDIEVADLRDQLNIFELVGPKSSQVIHGALTPIKGAHHDEFKKFWQIFGQLQTAGSAPRGMIVGFTVIDPRLNFPPKNTKVIDKGPNLEASLPIGLWPTAKLAATEIWNEAKRTKLGQLRFKKKDIDARKSNHLVPGTKLSPLRQDDRVPILLIQRSIEAQGISAPLGASFDTTRPLHGWTLIVPKGWGMSFFSSLTHTGTRVGGLDECTIQRFEAGCLTFPTDYPCTDGYASSSRKLGQEEKERWERKPPTKRANWEKLGIENPWNPDWIALLGSRKDVVKVNDEQRETDLVLTQRETPEEATDGVKTTDPQISNTIEGNVEIHPWLLRGPEAPSLIESISHSHNPALDLSAKLNAWRRKLSIHESPSSENALLRGALVNVRLSIPRSGTPEQNALIYRMDDKNARKWRALVDDGDGESSESQLNELKPSKDAVVGYVTSGHYSLSLGRGRAIGAISLTSYLEMREQLHRLGKVRSFPLVKFRNKNSSICRVAFVELVC